MGNDVHFAQTSPKMESHSSSDTFWPKRVEVFFRNLCFCIFLGWMPSQQFLLAHGNAKPMVAFAAVSAPRATRAWGRRNEEGERCSFPKGSWSLLSLDDPHEYVLSRQSRCCRHSCDFVMHLLFQLKLYAPGYCRQQRERAVVSYHATGSRMISRDMLFWLDKGWTGNGPTGSAYKTDVPYTWPSVNDLLCSWHTCITKTSLYREIR